MEKGYRFLRVDNLTFINYSNETIATKQNNASSWNIKGARGIPTASGGAEEGSGPLGD